MVGHIADALARVVDRADDSLELVDRARDELSGSTRVDATRPASMDGAASPILVNDGHSAARPAIRSRAVSA
jgi:hypothetical protein